jgi:hypothetical protein
MRVALLILCAATLVAAAATRYGHGGHGFKASTVLSYQGVLACVFELTDINNDRQLSGVELRVALSRWLKPMERALDGLTEHRLLAQCDTDSSGTISWQEAIEEPRCITLSQVEGLAKWMCARAKHGDFVFDEYLGMAVHLQQGLVSGKALKTFRQEFDLMAKSQTDARRAALARSTHTARFSDEVNALISDFGSTVSNVVVVPIAVFIVVLSLFIACLA